ncbi:hypothetical protein [Lutibacter maritimus]|uniref:Uncharacterized protein n=1 Tax=Lutibacter maritimus TaxID=593133 RepID=A0A1I6NR97_9FLAO|nr:hypothetical protein [Lutibacter maritimus]SFS30410.1 hypothetical protein SAMN04488006_0433 [Lutibacter maritimus]
MNTMYQLPVLETVFVCAPDGVITIQKKVSSIISSYRNSIAKNHFKTYSI